MSLRTVYQTLRDKNNIAEVLAHGPYICNKSNAWLHDGYYFWEEFIEPAIHWGKTWCQNKYIITKAECLILPEDMFDLVGNLHHIRQVKDIVEYLTEEGLVTEETSVAHVIDYLKKEEVFDYIAARTQTTESFRQKYKLQALQYDVNNKAVFLMNPAVQICIYDLQAAMLSDFEVVYPE